MLEILLDRNTVGWKSQDISNSKLIVAKNTKYVTKINAGI